MNAAAEMFQNANTKLLSNIPGARNHLNDLIVHEKVQAEHYEKTQMQPTSSSLENKSQSMMI